MTEVISSGKFYSLFSPYKFEGFTMKNREINVFLTRGPKKKK